MRNIGQCLPLVDLQHERVSPPADYLLFPTHVWLLISTLMPDTGRVQSQTKAITGMRNDAVLLNSTVSNCGGRPIYYLNANQDSGHLSWINLISSLVISANLSDVVSSQPFIESVRLSARPCFSELPAAM